MGCARGGTLWRIDEEGTIIWATQLTNLTDLSKWIPDDQHLYPGLLIHLDVALGGSHLEHPPSPEHILPEGDGTFILVGNLALEGEVPELTPHSPYVIKFRDPDLAAICPRSNPEPIAEPALLLAISTVILIPLLLLLVPGLLDRVRARGT